MTHDTLCIDVAFPAERTIASWEERYARGDVPGRWPYGLDALSEHAAARATSLRAPRRRDRLLSLAHVPRRQVADAVGLTWDENSAVRMQQVAPHARHVSGAIWLSDVAARGADLGRMPAALARTAALWVLSDAQVQPLRDLVPGHRVEYVRFGIDSEFFSARPPATAPRVVSVGGDRDRDAETLFRALSLVRRRRPDVDAVVQTTSRIAPPDGVRTIAHLPHRDLRELYASASVVAVATRPNLHVSGMTVSLEAMATGRPVAITRTPGMADYIADGRTGLLSDPHDADALSRNILAFLDDPDRAASFGVEARRAVEERFTSRGMASAIARVVRDVS